MAFSIVIYFIPIIKIMFDKCWQINSKMEISKEIIGMYFLHSFFFEKCFIYLPVIKIIYCFVFSIIITF